MPNTPAGTAPPEDPDLGTLIKIMADAPSQAARDAFYRRLLTSKVGFHVPGSDLPSGPHTTTADRPMDIPTATLEDGEVYIAVFCDVPRMHALKPSHPIAQLEAIAVLRMARDKGFGVIVENRLDPANPWAGVSKDDVAWLLKHPRF